MHADDVRVWQCDGWNEYTGPPPGGRMSFPIVIKCRKRYYHFECPENLESTHTTHDYYSIKGSHATDRTKLYTARSRERVRFIVCRVEIGRSVSQNCYFHHPQPTEWNSRRKKNLFIVATAPTSPTFCSFLKSKLKCYVRRVSSRRNCIEFFAAHTQ